MTQKRKLFSLFSGAGGLDLGFVSHGAFEAVFANEISSTASETYSANFGTRAVPSSDRLQVPSIFVGDIAELRLEELRNIAPDVLTGGPPCQDFSIVRGPDKERKGIRVSRGRLYSHFVRALIFLQPKAFVFENVPGLLSANKGMAYRTILDDFSNLKKSWKEIQGFLERTQSDSSVEDYQIIFDGLVDASKLGAPQARRRVIILGVRKDLIETAWWKLYSLREIAKDSLTGKGTLVSKYPLVPIEAFEGEPLPALESRYKEVMKAYESIPQKVATRRARRWETEVWKKLSFDITKDYMTANKINPAGSREIDEAFENHVALLKELGYLGAGIGGLKCPDRSNVIPQESKAVLERMSMIPPDENHVFVGGTKWEVQGRGFSLIYRRIHPLKPSYTVVAYGGGGTWGYHYERDRSKLTNRERARIQTFPDQFLFRGNKSEVRAQIGEAVPPILGRRIAEAIDVVLREVS